MKRINILIAVIIATLFVACSSSSFEDVALERSKLYITPYDDYVHIDFSSDSICIIGRYSVFEGSDITQSEYYLMRTYGPNSELVECFYDVNDERKPLKHFAEDMLGELPKDKNTLSKDLRGGAFVRDRNLWKKVSE